MDLVTQGLLGGAIGQAIGARKLGRKAVFWGTVAGLLPDLDSVVQFSNPLMGFVYHRWITHSLFFSLIIGPLMGWGLASFYARRSDIQTKNFGVWISLCFWALLTHPLLDIMTSYGTQFLSPFQDTRFRLDAISVVDFGYTVPLVFCLVWGRRLLKKGKSIQAEKIARLTLAITTLYLLMTLLIREASYHWAKDQTIIHFDIPTTFVTHPTLMLPFERKVIVQRQDQTTCVAHWHLWKGALSPWQCRKNANQLMLDKVMATSQGKMFAWFTGGDYFAESLKQGRHLKLYDIRYAPFKKPFQGLWGLEFFFDESGNVEKKPTYFRTSWQERSRLLRSLLVED